MVKYYAKDRFKYLKWGYTNNPKDKKENIIETYDFCDIIPKALAERLLRTNPGWITSNKKEAIDLFKKQIELDKPSKTPKELKDDKAKLKKLGTEVIEEVPEPKTKKKLTEEEIYDLKKSEQVNLLHKLGYGGAIPRYEKGKVALIMELQ